MKRLFSIFAACLGILAFTQCSQEKQDPVSSSIKTSVEALSVEWEGGEKTIDVTSDVLTYCRLEGCEGNWATVEPGKLTNGGTLKLTFSKNVAFQKERKCTLLITGVGVKKSIEITQAGCPEEAVPEITIMTTHIGADVEGGEYEIEVKCDAKWTVETDANWITLPKGELNGNTTFKATVKKSEDYAYRTAKITVRAGKKADPKHVEVEQVGIKIGNTVWATANVDQPKTFCQNREGRGCLYVWNTQKAYETGSANDHGAKNDAYSGFELGAKDAGTNTWLKENDPCPEGWRVASIEDWHALIYQQTEIKHFFFDYDMKCGMSVAGAFVGKDPESAKKYKKGEDLQGCIFVPQAGQIKSENAMQEDWWSASLWARETVGKDNTWDATGVYFDGNQNMYDNLWLANTYALSVRCVLDQAN